MWVILNLGISGLIHAFAVGREVLVWPGILLLLFSFQSREALGYGDSWLMLALEMWIPWTELSQVFLGGIVLAAAAGICSGKKEIPLVPFLAAVYLVREYV